MRESSTYRSRSVSAPLQSSSQRISSVSRAMPENELVSSPGANSISPSPSASAYSPDHANRPRSPAEFTHVAPPRTALSIKTPTPFS